MTEKVVEPKEEPIVPKTPTVEELMAENARLKSHNEKTIGEKKSAASELAQLKADQDERRQEDLKQKEDYKTLLDDANKTIANQKVEISTKDENALSKSIAFEVQKLAGDAKDISDIMDKINISEENIDLANGNLTDLAEQIDAIRKSKPYLFEVKPNSMATKLPNMNGAGSSKSDKRPLKVRIAEQLMKK